MNTKKIVAVLMAATLLCGMLASCQKEDDRNEDEPITPETAAPIADELQTDYTADADKLAYINAFGDLFSNMAETSGAEFTVTVNSTGVTVTGYTGKSAEVRVPGQIDGKTVTAIGDRAFAENSVITKLYLPDSVTGLGEGSLEGMTALRALRTPMLGETANSKQYLGYLFGAAKYEDNSAKVPATLEYLELGGNMEALDDFALFECNDLICMTLPDSMKTLGSYSLYDCSGLLAINVDKLTAVADHALDSCIGLTRLEFGDGLTSIGLGALEGCISLRTLILPFAGGSSAENTYLGYVFGAATPDFAEGYYPPYLNRVTLLSTATAIGDYAFYKCKSLESVGIPEGVTAIGVRAFSGCERLETVGLPDSLSTISENAFFGCISMENLIFSDNSHLNAVGVNAFYSCDGLLKVDLPLSLSALPASCFADCVSLETVDLGGVTSVGKNAFYKCTRLQKITAQQGVTFAQGNEVAEKLLNGEEA